MFKYLTLLIAVITFSLPAKAQVDYPPSSKEQINLTFSPIVKKVAPAVVNIYTKRLVTSRLSPFMSDPFFNHFFGGSRSFGGITKQRVESALGSGVILEADGLVVTNAHVVKDAQEITIVLSDGREFSASKLLVDEPSDLALLRADTRGIKLPFATLTASESLEVGDLVLAIGNPFGVGQTVTSGIVSAVARSSLNINDFNFFIQTDAAINPGNSGGALVDINGGVVGINTAIFSRSGGSLGIGFAIPSEMVSTLIAAETSGRAGEDGVARAWLGMTGQSVTQDISDSLGLMKPGGVLISSLHKASPAKKAGLKVGDIVLSVNNRAVRDPAELKFRLATVPIGEVARLELLRDGGKGTIQIEAQLPPEDPERNETIINGDNPLDGATIVNINPAVAIEMNINEEEGVIITGIDRSRRSARLVSPGDIISNINGEDIDDVDDVIDEISDHKRGAWQFIITRNGKSRQVVVR